MGDFGAIVPVPFRAIDDGRHDLSVRSPVDVATVIVNMMTGSTDTVNYDSD